MRKFIVKRLVKPFLKKQGIEMCKACDDAIATSSYSLCAECQDAFDKDMIAIYNRDMKEAVQ
ncbi:MAG: hypothetical protein Tp1100DCM51572_46 [Prokaryotic dsDNA virus sp.]|nr:MAG: hypothetical protein Tp1100DCM51572_46 [Prokaryotic dsDNA virus sp.]|tara:strand:- start:22526 stop:22711 length:186 start_codon:yes stop_codon:yes gene_type:complete